MNRTTVEFCGRAWLTGEIRTVPTSQIRLVRADNPDLGMWVDLESYRVAFEIGTIRAVEAATNDNATKD